MKRLLLSTLLVVCVGGQAAELNPAENGNTPAVTDSAHADFLSKRNLTGPARELCIFGPRDPEGRKLAIARYGGSAATEASVEQALRWLAIHQEADGHWSATKCGANYQVDTAVTALALLALLGAGNSEKTGTWRTSVSKAVTWLKSKQENGLIFDRTDAGGHRGIAYPTAIATLAMCEAGAMGRQLGTLGAAQAAINYCMREHQLGEGLDRLGWRYMAKSIGDLSVSGWFILALQSAKTAGLLVDSSSIEGAKNFLNNVEVKEKGVSRYGYQPGKDTTPRRNAIGNLARLALGTPKDQLQASIESFVAEGGVPKWSKDGSTVDFYYWYFGTSCAFQHGGELWNRWNEGLKKALVESQSKQGDDAGSWPVVGEFSAEWGRVGQTALGCLCLEVYYRYKMAAGGKE